MTNKPIKTFQAGNVEVAVWENRNDEQKVFHSFSIKRSYVDERDGQWKDTGVITLLPLHGYDLEAALREALTYVRIDLRQERKQQNAQSETSEKQEPAVSESPEQPELPSGGASSFAGKESQRRSGSSGRNR